VQHDDGNEAVEEPPSLAQLQPSGEEAGSPPGDRQFRPDVEGLRAVAIVLVVMLHFGVPHLAGGIVGVDVFFVISGFVITGLLLRETTRTGSISFLDFYARRARRLLPMALFVITLSMIVTALVASHRDAVMVASDARWSALFVANFHFARVDPNVLVTRVSPFTAWWSLAVEEQYYVIYPAFLALLLLVPVRWSVRARIAAGLFVVVALSFAWSVAISSRGQLGPYDSLSTRAWELAVGGLVALGGEWFARLPTPAAALATWIGVGGIIVSGLVLSVAYPYPGSVAALPVVSTALVIAGGFSAPRWGAEALLGARPFGWLGRRSYSWYLWHSSLFVLPVLAAGAAHSGGDFATLPLTDRLGWAALSLVVAAITYALIENPVRHSTWLLRNPRSTMLGAALLVASCVAFSYAF
jgi:peptidoglycan/LPS O-acetylase OafA/YrhL